MQERMQAELVLIQRWFPDVEYREEGHWVCVPSYPLPEGWNRSTTNVAFQIPVTKGYPAAPPYGIYVPSGLQFQGVSPNNYKDLADNQPPFGGTWGVFSWSPADGEWRPTDDVRIGSNLLNWVKGVADRFSEGQ